MTDNYAHIDELLAKRLAGETTKQEEALIESWLQESADNSRYFDSLQRLWSQAPTARAATLRPVDTESALQKVRAQMQPAAPVARRISMYQWMPAAAAVLALVVAAVFFFRNETDTPEVQIAAATSTLTDTLTDGSVVVLNRNSALRIAGNFNKKERRMRLEGEAYFAVAHDREKPFVIEVQQLEVKVVGTEFNVDNRSEPGRVKVSVTEGKVQLSAGAQNLLLVAGEQAIYESGSGNITRVAKPNPNVLAYKNRYFDYDATPLGQVVRELSDVYGVDISLKNKVLENCILHARYDNLELDRVLDLIADSFSLTVEKKDGKVVLDGTGCGGNDE
ncbi:MAG: FecR domain-containing protein [Bacteroidetes bacterium]|nr:FecR domain-containing protein [Bacteroidota bacterium]